MDAADKHYKIVNSKTGYAIYYCSVHAGQTTQEIKAELDKVKAQVASNNGLYEGTLYWEEIKEEA